MAPAKINLSLDVTGKREDGYHLLDTVMQTIDLYDTISVRLIENDEQKPGTIKIIADKPTFPCDSRNTCYKAAFQFLLEWGRLFSQNPYLKGSSTVSIEKKWIEIDITKKIPQAAGLAGGSADAAAVLTAMNELFGMPFSKKNLRDIGVKVGADVPFCLMGGTVRCRGIGEILTELKPLQEIPVVLVKPPFGVSTPWVFSVLNLHRLGKQPNTQEVIRAIEKSDIAALFRATSNVLETVTLPEYPELARIKELLLESGATGSLMSGSGPTVFGIFPSRTAASKAADMLRNTPETAACTIIATRTVTNGPVVLKKTE